MTRKQAQKWLDGSAVGLSFLCLVHCLLLPLAVAFAPALGVRLLHEDETHLWLLLLAVPVSAISLVIGFRRHKRWNLIGMGGIGLVLMYLGLGGGVYSWATTITLTGAAILAYAHWLNWRQEAEDIQSSEAPETDADA